MQLSAVLRRALFIRCFEENLLELYRQGRLHGTLHACIGQELSAVAFCGQTLAGDLVVSNHRCHGHYLAFTGDAAGLLAEMLGRRTGVSGGVGGSQHLCNGRFFSNGIQGGMLPVAAGLAETLKREQRLNVVLAFLGDGTLGQGVLYETLNLVALRCLPVLFVLEHNGYAQSTPTAAAVAGVIEARAEAFGIATRTVDTNDPERLLAAAHDSLAYVREQQRPLFHVVRTQRLCAHSKGDDFRSVEELTACRQNDALEQFARCEPHIYAGWRAEIGAELATLTAAVLEAPAPVAAEYIAPLPRMLPAHWQAYAPPTGDGRMIAYVNRALTTIMQEHPRVICIGEDILSPYGGAFKATQGLSQRWPDRVVSTPISEAAITGFGNGLALGGWRPVVEIMFGDFVTLTLDQLLNHAAKFRGMYGGRVRCPLVLRTPMGGRRGYGPTHSQTLDRLLVGIPDLLVVALNFLVEPLAVYRAVMDEVDRPVVVLENKVDYTCRFGEIASPLVRGFAMETDGQPYPLLRLSPRGGAPQLSLVTYGGMLQETVRTAERLFEERELLAEIVVITQLSPFAAGRLDAALQSDRVVWLEEGTTAFGVGSEVVAGLAAVSPTRRYLRIGAAPVPIPAEHTLELAVLPQAERIVQQIGEAWYGDY